ncbi:MAG TPA: Gldg family protein [Myxococcota bacterium]|nr:Gldg family protein [Myxococcota bacterium]HRY92745.1 Gldg family protein [Myxococcota bacterium]HSA20713.1 Gldg family protein [Myxococcota bacterium]
MNAVLAVARKEWRAAFLSPVALVFLGVFLLSSLFVLFYLQGFFARNTADARPFFQAMPYLLALLTAAFSMRLWSEEARSGTLEVLLTLPVPLRRLALGKFLAGLGLVAVALALTLPLPITVACLGDLDWGPVVGGYLGLLLLSGAYLSLGMLISALTSNQLVALMMSLLGCGLLALVGALPGLVGVPLWAGDVLRALGTSSRFESMLRGVLDARDLVYYASLSTLFLTLNGLVLERRRWGRSAGGRARRRALGLTVGLLIANLLALNLGLAPQRGLRIDLTERGEFSLSPVTRELLAGLDQPLLVRGYFSERTHPLLAPLVPAVRDFLAELQAEAGARVQVDFLDPTKDPEAEQEAYDKYGVRNVPFRFADRLEDSVVNAYFHLLVRYGDQVEVLGYEDLVDVEVKGTEVTVRLRNLEYDLARSVQKAVAGFRGLESVCARLPDQARLTLVATVAALPEELQAAPARVVKVAEEVKRQCGGRFDFLRVDPDQPGASLGREELVGRYGLKPMSADFLGERTFYLDLLLEVAGRAEILDASRLGSEAEVKKVLLAALQRRTPGFLKTVGLVTPAPAAPGYPGMPPDAGGGSYRSLERKLRESYEVLPVDLSRGQVGGEVDVLMVLGPRELGERERFALDQFLVRGGAVILAAGAYAFEPQAGGELSVTPRPSGLEPLLEAWGVKLEDAVALDEQNAPFPVPVYRKLGGLSVREIQLVNYPPFVLVGPEGMAPDHPALQALPALVMQWASPVRCPPAAGDSTPAGALTCSVLAWSSARAWAQKAFDAQPDYERFPELGFAAPAERERLPLVVALVGRFESAWKGKPGPALEEPPPPAWGEEDAPPPADPAKVRRASVRERGDSDGRLVVLGSSAALEDTALAIAEDVSELPQANLMFAANLVDWAVQDARLLGIRGKQRYARTLGRLEEGDKLAVELGLFAFALLAVTALGLWGLGRRRFARPVLPAAGGQGVRS